MSEVLDKLNALKEREDQYTDQSKETMRAIEKDLKRALITQSLLDHDGIKMLLEKYRLEVQSIENRLKSDREIDEIGRQFLFERKTWCEELLGYFTRAESTVESINQTLDTALQQ